MKWMDGLTDGWMLMNKWIIDGWVNGSVDGWMNGWMDGC